MTSPESPRCPTCGATLASDGLCARCLFGAGAELAMEAPQWPRPFGDHYELLGELGRGGAGRVFRARDRKLDRIVALKLLQAGDLAPLELRERFRAEAMAVAALEHPGIVPVLEAGVVDGQPFFTMPLLARGSLAEHMRAGAPMTPQATVALIGELARATHHAHERGVLHRDIKPGNVLLDAEGRAHLSDFGLARLESRPLYLTQTRVVMGTPAYMAPEQAAGAKGATTATDIYSLGAVFYELLAGQPPFDGGSSVEVVQKVLHHEPRRPSVVRAGVPRDLETVCLRCLEKNPAHRYSSAAALAEDLDRWRRGEPVLARPCGPAERLWKWARRRPAIAALSSVAVLSVLALTAVSTVMSIRLARSQGETAAQAEQRRRTLVEMNVADATRLAQDHDLCGALRSSVEALALEEAGPDPAGAVQRARERVGAMQRVCPVLRHVWRHSDVVRDGLFSPDGKLIVSLSGDTLTGYDAATGQTRLGPLDAGALDHGQVRGGIAFDRSGRRLLCHGAVNYKANVRVLDIATGAWLWPAAPVTLGALFSPDGERLLVSQADGVRWLDAATGAPAAVFHAQPATALAVSADGRQVAVGDSSGSVFLYDAATGAALHGPLLSGQKGSVNHLAFSPDGQCLAACNGELFVAFWQTAGGTLSGPVTRHSQGIAQMIFSPDGRRLLIGASWATRLRDPSGREPQSDLIAHPGYLSMSSFHPQSRILATAGADGCVYFWEAGSSRETLTRLHHTRQVHTAVWSPDGRSLLTTCNDGLLRLWDLPPEDFSVLKVKAAALPAALGWSADGRRIEARGKTEEAWDAATGEAVTLASPPGPALPKGAVLSPDGSVYAISTGPAGEFELRDPVTGARRGTGLAHPGARNPTTMNFVFSADSRRLLSVPHDSTVGSCAAEMWDVATGRPAGYDLRHTDGILGAAFSPDGRLIATASEDTTARLWNARDGSAAGAFAPHGYWVWSVAFSPDNTRVASVSSDHTANVWDVRTLAALAPKLPHDRIVQRVAWSPDGLRLATAESGGTIRVWSLAPATASVAELRAGVRRLFTGETVPREGR